MPPVPTPPRALLVAGMMGSLERAGASVTVVVPCASPADLHLRRLGEGAPGSTRVRGAPVPLPEGPLARAAHVTSGDPEAAAALFRSAALRAAALGAIELCETLDLDGRTARATALPGSDDGAVQDLARRMVLLTTVVRALSARQQRARTHRAQALAAPESSRRAPVVPPPLPEREAQREREGELIFFGPLHELVAMGLYRPAIDGLCAGAREIPAAPIDRGYLLKILDEEVGRQFGHPLRPVVELVLNAVDASAHAPRGAAPGEGATVEVKLGPGSVSVSDAGAGMDLRTILSRLLIPFATDKRPGVDIGRFGVGFFSVLGFGLAHPDSFSLRVCTGDGRESWTLSVIAGGPMADALLCSVRRGGPVGPGTEVCVSSSLLEADAIRSYLKDALHFLPSSRAVIRLDGAPLNDGSLLCGGRLFEDVVAAGDPPLVARFQLGGRGLAGGISAATYHAGVKVESCLAISELTLIDFPGAVELTEGRDALKPGPEFNAVATAFHRRLLGLAAGADAGRELRDRLAEVAAQVSSMLLQSASWSAMAPEIARELLGPDRFLISPERAEAIVGFLGSRVARLLFVPESFWAEREWHSYMPGERELLERELEVEPPEPLPALVARRPDLLGLPALLRRATSGSVVVSLVRTRRDRPRRGGGCLPCLGTRRAVLLREDSAAIARPRGWMDHYALRASFDRATGLRESEVERDLIVTDPVVHAGGRA